MWLHTTSTRYKSSYCEGSNGFGPCPWNNTAYKETPYSKTCCRCEENYTCLTWLVAVAQMTRLKPQLWPFMQQRGGLSSCKRILMQSLSSCKGILSSSSHFRESLTSMVGMALAHEQWLCSDQTPFARMEWSRISSEGDIHVWISHNPISIWGVFANCPIWGVLAPGQHSCLQIGREYFPHGSVRSLCDFFFTIQKL